MNDMNQLIQYLKDNLKIEMQIRPAYDEERLELKITINGQLISEDWVALPKSS